MSRNKLASRVPVPKNFKRSNVTFQTIERGCYQGKSQTMQCLPNISLYDINRVIYTILAWGGGGGGGVIYTNTHKHRLSLSRPPARMHARPPAHTRRHAHARTRVSCNSIYYFNLYPG